MGNKIEPKKSHIIEKSPFSLEGKEIPKIKVEIKGGEVIGLRADIGKGSYYDIDLDTHSITLAAEGKINIVSMGGNAFEKKAYVEKLIDAARDIMTASTKETSLKIRKELSLAHEAISQELLKNLFDNFFNKVN